jgi:BlaI family transcriptional regulator, penicillinase repressor
MATKVKKSIEPSELEMQVLGILWEQGPRTARQVLDSLRDGKTRAYTTILTIMQVMHRKGLISRMPGEGLAHVYKSAVTRKQVFKPFFGKLVSKAFGGNPSAVLQQLLELKTIDADDLAEMKEMIEKSQAKKG